MKLIVGLGNPGEKYKNSRHNIGFSLVDYIVRAKGLSFKKGKFNALECQFYHGDEAVLIVKPLSFMNLSGDVVCEYVNYYKIDLDDLLVIQDDLDMNLGRIKVVYDSSCGGHNGVRDISNKLGSSKYVRLKIGISRDCDVLVVDYVLSNFNSEELSLLDSKYKILEFFIDDFCDLSLDMLMSKYNRK